MCFRRAFSWRWISSGRVEKPATNTRSSTSATSTTSSRVISSPVRRGGSRRRPPSNTQNAGPRMLDLFAQLHSKSIEIERLRAEDRDDRARLSALDLINDQTQVDLERLSRMPWANNNYPRVIAAYTSDLPSINEDSNVVKTWLEENQDALDQGVGEVDALWLQVYGLSWSYFNECLGTNFNSNWSMHRTDCINMRRRLVDPYEAIVRSRDIIHSLKIRLVYIHTEQRMLQLRARSANSTQASRNRTNARLTELAREEQDIESELFPHQGALARREEKLQELQIDVIHGLIESLLESAGRLPQEVQGSQSGYDGGSPQRSSSPLDETMRQSPFPTAEAANTNGDGEPTLESLLDEYRASRRRLEALQSRIGLDGRNLRDEFDEVDHLLTFTSLTPEGYAAYVSSYRTVGANALADAEAEFDQARENLLAAGGTPPADSVTSSPRSRRSTDSAMIRRLNRRRINDYRFSQRPVSPGSIASRSRSSIPEFGTDNTRGISSGRMTPSPGRVRRLRDYEDQQDRVRRQETERRQGAQQVGEDN